VTGPAGISDDDQFIRDEARRRLDEERQEAERRAAHEVQRLEHEAMQIRDEARLRAVTEHLHDRFGHALAVLHDPDLFVTLMTHARLVHTKKEIRVNPTGTTTEITTVTVPRLLAVACNTDCMSLLFDGNIGHTLAGWATSSDILRSGFRATSLQISEPKGGQFQVALGA
jgi:hypothetical protein